MKVEKGEFLIDGRKSAMMRPSHLSTIDSRRTDYITTDYGLRDEQQLRRTVMSKASTA